MTDAGFYHLRYEDTIRVSNVIITWPVVTSAKPSPVEIIGRIGRVYDTRGTGGDEGGVVPQLVQVFPIDAG